MIRASDLLSSNQVMIMGILNVTPDSFSDGGSYHHPIQALTHALDMVRQGADIIDIGGESTRPGSDVVNVDTQLSRILPVVQELEKRSEAKNTVISVDTTRSAVAEAAIDRGASLINDITAGQDDPDMFSLAAKRGVSIVLMHKKGTPMNMQDQPCYTNVIEEIKDFFIDRIRLATSAGIHLDKIILDPGIGFGKTTEHNLQILANLHEFVAFGLPILLGASRKRFMGAICQELEPVQLLGGTIATTVMGVMAGVKIFRVHDVKSNRQAADVTQAIALIQKKQIKLIA